MRAGFECFLYYGFDRTSLSAIAKAAGVTRGAIYWHFEDKKELFRAVVDYNLERGDITDYGKTQPPNLGYTERLADMFWYGLNDNPHVEFVFKALIIANNDPEFSDVVKNILALKRRLWDFIDVETRVYMRLHGRFPTAEETSIIASTLSLMFEGMFLAKNIQVGIQLDKEYVLRYTSLVTASLIFDTQPERWQKIRPLVIGMPMQEEQA